MKSFFLFFIFIRFILSLFQPYKRQPRRTELTEIYTESSDSFPETRSLCSSYGRNIHKEWVFTETSSQEPVGPVYLSETSL